jgi:plasmid stabilization system protein ParE
VKPLKYLSIAEIELAEAAKYYEEQQPGVGKAFLDAVSEAGERIRQNPEMWAFYEKPIRSFKVAPFPYRLLYRELPDRLQIVAVAHLSRRPGYWKTRLS